MSSIFGDKEAPLASTRVKDKPDKKDEYRFQWLKRLVDRLFPARMPDFRSVADAAVRTRQ